MELPNTAVHYRYRDGSNYKRAATAIVNGRLSEAQIRELYATLDEGLYFLPTTVGLPHCWFTDYGYDPTADHPWHELPEGGIEPTDCEPTETGTAVELLARFQRCSRWDVEQANVDMLASWTLAWAQRSRL